MASSEKSEKLRLSLWEPTDMPERLDFRHDNEQLESLVGGHLADSSLHITASEKQYLTKPMAWAFCQGDGQSGCFTSPPIPVANLKAVLIFADGKPPAHTDENGVTHVYWDFWVNNQTNTSKPFVSGGGGLVVQGTSYGRKNIQVGTRYYHLNEQGVWYVAVFIPKT